jgi:alcohol dehydrogenase class IV
MATNRYRRFVLPEIIFGRDARSLAGRYARGFDARRALLVSDPGVKAAGWTDQVGEMLRQAGLEVIEFFGVSPNPRDFEVNAGIRACLEAECDLVVGVGGGSPLDCAKCIAICVTNGGSVLGYGGVDKIPLPGLPLICVPTTAGTSADISQFAIVNDSERHVKIAIVSKKAIPDAALIDPDTTSTMPSELTAATGMDALCHATEAYVSLGASDLTDLPALEAARLIGRWLEPAYEAARMGCRDAMEEIPHGCEAAEEARHGMMLASLLAGEAFSNASLGLVHAMAHSLGGLLDAPHGLCNAILLDKVALANVAFAGNGSASNGEGEAARRADARYARLAAAIRSGRAEAAGKEGGEARPKEGGGAEAFAEMVAELRSAIGLEKTLADLGMKRGDIPKLASFAASDPCLATNPRTMQAADIEKVYERAL